MTMTKRERAELRQLRVEVDGLVRAHRALARRLQRLETPEVPIGGICQRCGCTELTPCFGGCAWANKDQTLCTACLTPGELAVHRHREERARRGRRRKR